MERKHLFARQKSLKNNLYKDSPLHYFTYKNGHLHAEDVDLINLAASVETPFYVYSEATFRRHYRVFANAFQSLDTLIAYSVKANSNIAILKVLASEGAGADIVSGGELYRAQCAGIAPDKIVFSGVGKTEDEMRAGLHAGIYQFNVESESELIRLDRVAGEANLKAPIALRINPDVKAGGHVKISTGKSEDKFGVAWADARRLYGLARELANIEVKGVDVHIGSQISDLEPFERAFRKVGELIADLRADGCTISRLDLGGGLGIPYGEGVAPPHPDDYASMIRQVTKPLDVQLIFEPGRMIAGNAGILVSRVNYVKAGEAKTFLILDAGMNDLIRPAFYDAHHDILPVCEPDTEERIAYDVVGPVCETADRFAKSRNLSPLEEGDLVAIMSAGAYGAVQSSQYNTRPLAPEILVNGDRYAMIRKRPTFEEIVLNELTPDWLD